MSYLSRNELDVSTFKSATSLFVNVTEHNFVYIAYILITYLSNINVSCMPMVIGIDLICSSNSKKPNIENLKNQEQVFSNRCI